MSHHAATAATRAQVKAGAADVQDPESKFQQSERKAGWRVAAMPLQLPAAPTPSSKLKPLDKPHQKQPGFSLSLLRPQSLRRKIAFA